MSNKRKRLRRFKCRFGIHRVFDAFGYPGVTFCEDCKTTWVKAAPSAFLRPPFRSEDDRFDANFPRY